MSGIRSPLELGFAPRCLSQCVTYNQTYSLIVCHGIILTDNEYSDTANLTNLNYEWELSVCPFPKTLGSSSGLCHGYGQPCIQLS